MARPLFHTLACVSLILTSLAYAPSAESAELSPREALIARAAALELDTAYERPPGEALHHHAAGFAKVLCSAIFLTGLDEEFAVENIGFFTAPYAQRKNVVEREIDRAARAVRLTLQDGTVRTAQVFGDQGCVALEEGAHSLSFEPSRVSSALPDPSEQDWPMGDRLPVTPFPDEVDRDAITAAIDIAFEPPQALTAAVVVTHRGRLVGERYRPGITMHTPLESWSMGKSLTATLMGLLIQQGVYQLDQPAPIPEWHETSDDPRAEIPISSILRMSSGLRFRAPQDPDFDPALGYPDHLYIYTGPNAFAWAATRPRQWPHNTVGRYRNSDPVLINYLIRLAVEGRGEDYHSFPQRALFDKLGIRDLIIETDPHGNFLSQGYDFGAARDWARLGNLYLQDGVWNGERLLPEGFVEFVSTVAPAWKADRRPIYGGFFWINNDDLTTGTRRFPIETRAFYMAGAGGQYTVIVPDHELVVVRLGHYRGGGTGLSALGRALERLVKAVPTVATDPR